MEGGFSNFGCTILTTIHSSDTGDIYIRRLYSYMTGR